MKSNHGDLIRYTLLAYSAVMTQPVCANTINTENKQYLRLEEIVVTARKRQEPLQDAPLSVSAFSEDRLYRMGVTDLGDLSANVPSLSLAPFPNSSSALTVYMRGIGTVDSEQIARDPGVGI